MSARLPRDHYVRVDSNDYSVDPSVIGRTVEIAAGLEEVTVTCGRCVLLLVAEHTRTTNPYQLLYTVLGGHHRPRGAPDQAVML
jgi:hypothetical protein